MLRMPLKMLDGCEHYCCATGSRPSGRVQLRVPLTVIIEAVDQLEADELRLLAQRLEERLAATRS